VKNRQGSGREARAAKIGAWAGLRDIRNFGFDATIEPLTLPDNRAGRRRMAAERRKGKPANAA